jgi:hypothetical protein
MENAIKRISSSEAPDAYYDFLAGRITRAELFIQFPEAHLEA